MEVKEKTENLDEQIRVLAKEKLISEMKEERPTSKETKSVKWGGVINEFFWWCAGVNKRILRQCPTDYAKYTGSGGTIFFTAIMAVLSSGYALYFVFHDKWIAYGLGLVWGAMIFNLDRYIVNTMYSDGKPTISWGEVGAGLPRIIMAIFLGIVISTPLELKIFEDAIDIRIEQNKEKLLKERISGSLHERDSLSQKRDEIMNGVTFFDSQITTSSITTNNLLTDINDLQEKYKKEEAQISHYNVEIKKLEEKRNEMEGGSIEYQQISNEMSSLRSQRAPHIAKRNAIKADLNRKNGEVAASDETLGELLKTKQAETLKEAERLKHDIDSLSGIITEANIRHSEWSKVEVKQKGSFRDKLDVEYNGFQARMTAFSELKSENPATETSSIFIMLLFIIVEVAPTFFKMMMTSGPYDDMLRAEMHSVRVLSDKQISDINDGINTEVQISTGKNSVRLEAEVQANKKLMEQIALAQAELLETAINKWREEELEKIKENPSNYIKSNTSTDA